MTKERFDIELEYDYQDPRLEFEGYDDIENFSIAEEQSLLDTVNRAIRNGHYPKIGDTINSDGHSKFYVISKIIYYNGEGTGVRYYVMLEE